MKINILFLIIFFLNKTNEISLKKHHNLPIPEGECSCKGQFHIDRNINQKTIDNYLNRKDTVYIDLRMLKDEAKYENIGGDSYLSGFIKGFKVIPLPYLINVENLPKEVGKTYSGKTLFSYTKNGNIKPNYEESMDILEKIFPKDKNIFLMCGGGGYAEMAKEMLIKLGWDKNKLYNIGGFWNYKGNNEVKVKTVKDNKTYYDFSKVNLFKINLDSLHKL